MRCVSARIIFRVRSIGAAGLYLPAMRATIVSVGRGDSGLGGGPYFDFGDLLMKPTFHHLCFTEFNRAARYRRQMRRAHVVVVSVVALLLGVLAHWCR